ncbi:MAG: peptide ABC transporter substrate-binding protein [Phycisphaerales bacterium]
MWKLGVPLLLLAGALVLAVILDRPRPRADLVIINRGDIATLDLHRMSWLQDLRLAAALWEGLVRLEVQAEAATGRRVVRAVPGVAARWDISADERVYTFHLRPEARWSSGEPVTAEDVRRSWCRAILPDTGGDYLNLFGLIAGVREFVAWRESAVREHVQGGPGGGAREAAARALWAETLRRYDEQVGVRAPDAHTLIVTLARPTPYFLDVLGLEITAPVWMPGVEAFERLDARTGRMVTEPGWTRPGSLVTNGPYVLSEWRFKREMRLTKNPHYWNRDAVAIESISMLSVEDPSAQVIAARTGAVDWLTDVAAESRRELVAQMRQAEREHAEAIRSLREEALDPIEIRRRLPADERLHVHVFPSFGTFFLNLNCAPALPDGRPNPLRDPRLRRALALAVDKQAISDLRGIGEPVTGSITPAGSIAGYVPPSGLGYDPVEARRLLVESGVRVEGTGSPGAGGTRVTLPPIEILFNKDAGHDLVCQSIASDWRRELGVEVVLRQKERRAFREDLKNHNFMVTTANWFGDYGDPTTFLDINRTGDGNNDRAFADPEYDALLDEALDERDPERRMNLLASAERRAVEVQVPLIPLLHDCGVCIFDPHRLAGVWSHPRQKQQFGALRLIERPEDAPAAAPGR